jgi:hypothetical protein
MSEDEIKYMKAIQAARDPDARMDIYKKYISAHSAMIAKLK